MNAAAPGRCGAGPGDAVARAGRWCPLASAAGAEDGIRAIERDMRLLSPPNDAELDRAYANLKALHAEAFGWDPPDVGGLQRLGATRMRQYVRAWINEWDLTRLDPAFTPSTEVVDLPSNWAELPELDEP